MNHIDIIENDFKDWKILKVISQEIINNNIYYTITDEEGYKYFCQYDVIRNSRKRNLKLNKFFRGNKFTKDNIEHYLKINEIKISLKNLETDNAKDKIVFQCSKHGEFIKSWNEIKNGSYCPICSVENFISPKKHSYDYIYNFLKSINLTMVSNNYINNEQPIDFICNKHKEKGIQTAKFMNIMYKDGCVYCVKEKTIKNITKSNEKFIQDMQNIHGDKYKLLNEYKKSKEKVEILCNKCNNIFFIKASHLLSGHGCPNCNKSKGESKIELYLLNNNIDFISQYKFKDCIGIKRELPFDFAIFKNNNLICLIEYQGVQHYKPVEMFGGIDAFVIQQKMIILKIPIVNVII